MGKGGTCSIWRKKARRASTKKYIRKEEKLLGSMRTTGLGQQRELGGKRGRTFGWEKPIRGAKAHGVVFVSVSTLWDARWDCKGEESAGRRTADFLKGRVSQLQ